MSYLLTADRPTIVAFIATVGQVDFSAEFVIFEAGDLFVTVDGLEVGDYDIDGIGDEEGCAIAFDTPMAGGERVVLERIVPARRSVNLPSVGPYSTDQIDEEFDRLVALIQQNKSSFERTIRVPAGEEGVILPAAATRANLYPVFDADGVLILSSGTGSDAALRGDLGDGDGSLIGLGGSTLAIIDRSRPLTPEGYSSTVPGQGGDDTLVMQGFFEALAEDRKSGELGAGKTYIIEGDGVDSVILPVEAGFKLIGQGSTLQVADGSLGFHSMISSVTHTASAGDLSGLHIEGVIFDQNMLGVGGGGAGNISTSAANLSDGFRYTVHVMTGWDLSLIRNIVRNACSTNCFHLNGTLGERVGRTKINYNTFEGIGIPPNLLYFDHSTLYITGDEIEAVGNVFVAGKWGAIGAIAAIEVHPGNGCRIQGGSIYGYQAGINYAAVAETDSVRGFIAHLQMEVLRQGIYCLAEDYPVVGHTTGDAINGLYIDNVFIRIRNAMPRGDLPAVDSGGQGVHAIKFFSDGNLPVRNVRIGSRVHIEYDPPETVVPDYVGLDSGIYVAQTGAATIIDALYDRFVIESPTIINAPVMAICVGIGGGVFKNCSIGEPVIVNPGCTARTEAAVPTGIASLEYRAGIVIAAKELQGRFTIARAIIRDEQTVSQMTRGVWLSLVADSTACLVEIGVDTAFTVDLTPPASWRDVHLENANAMPLVTLRSRGTVTMDAAAEDYKKGTRATNMVTGILSEVLSDGGPLVVQRVSNVMGYVVGNWYLPEGSSGALQAGSGNPGSGTIRYTPFFVREKVVVSDLLVRVTTLFAGGKIRLGIYGVAAATGKPTGAVLATTAELSTAAADNVSGALAGGNLTLQPGLYWLAAMVDNATNVLASYGTANPHASRIVGSTDPARILASSGIATYHFQTPGVTFSGGLPDVTALTIAESTTLVEPAIGFKVA